ncbi:hypothetical protein EON78_06600 [bacterium]|nr:MAG: hypothetical protein EON78_06600 [bacterium]
MGSDYLIPIPENIAEPLKTELKHLLVNFEGNVPLEKWNRKIGKYFPKWIDDNHFSIGIRCDKGLGDYSIRICEDNTCYETVFKTTVIR